MVTAITRSNVVYKISIMLSVVREWIKNRRLTSKLVEFLEFVSTVGIYNQEIIRFPVQVALNMRPRFGPKQNGFRIHRASGRTNGAPRRLVPLMKARRFTLDPRLKKDRAVAQTGSLERASVAPPDVRLGSLAGIATGSSDVRFVPIADIAPQ